MARYTLQAFKSDVLQSPLNQGATSGTLTSGAFGSPTGPQLLVIDPETPAKREIISATISGTALTSITRGLDGTADVTHAANAPVIMAFVPSHYADLEGVLKNTRYYTANDTWTKPVGLSYIIVKLRAGGGGGGGVGTTPGIGAAGGGGQGEYAEKKILAAALGSTVAVTIGAGGAGGIGNNNGAVGGTTSFGSHVTAVGGGGGIGSPGNIGSRQGGAGGTGGTGADLAIRGERGRISINDTSAYFSGAGGGEGGGAEQVTNANGGDGVRGGGGGGAIDSGTTSRTGGAGGAGWMIVEEYF